MCSKLSDYFNSFAVFGFKQKIIYIYLYDVDIVLPASCLFARVCTTYDAMQLGKISTKSSSDANTNPESTNLYFFYEPEFVYIFEYIYSSKFK